MVYLNETLTNKLILFLKITKFDQFIRIKRLYEGQREPTLDKNVTAMEIYYTPFFYKNNFRRTRASYLTKS